MKCIGTSGPSSDTTQPVISSSSLSESLCPGMSSVVISSQTFVSRLMCLSVSRTGCR